MRRYCEPEDIQADFGNEYDEHPSDIEGDGRDLSAKVLCGVQEAFGVEIKRKMNQETTHCCMSAWVPVQSSVVDWPGQRNHFIAPSQSDEEVRLADVSVYEIEGEIKLMRELAHRTDSLVAPEGRSPFSENETCNEDIFFTNLKNALQMCDNGQVERVENDDSDNLQAPCPHFPSPVCSRQILSEYITEEGLHAYFGGSFASPCRWI